MTIGIYAIYFSKIDKVYIGQSQNIEQRFTSHRSLFKKGHYNYKIAEAFKLDSYPEYVVILSCKIEELNTLEITTINEFNSIEQGLNINYGGKAGILGFTNGKCKHTQEELEIAFNLLTDDTLTKKDIHNLSGVPITTLNSLICKKRHIWLHEYYPEVSKLILNNKKNRAANSQENRYKTYAILVSPEGLEYECTNRNKFANEHNLNSGHLGAVIRQQESQHKGWKLKKGVSTNE